MADDNNTAAELPPPGAEENSGGDSEQGSPSSSSSWVAAPITGGGTSTPTPSTVNTEVARAHQDKERQSKQMGRKAFAAVDILEARLNDKLLTGSLNANANINADMASEDASMTPQPPTQDAMEQIEDGDDGAPRPLNSAEFEDKSEPKLDLGEESADEDDGPPLPFQQRDSLSDAKKMEATSQISSSAASSSIAVDGNESVGVDSTVGDEENALQRVVRPETPAANYNERARRVGSTAAAERNPTVPILEAYLVEEEGPGGHDTVYEATPLEPELPWWKQRRTKVFMVINFVLVLIAALAVGLSVSPRSSPPPDSAAGNTTSITATTPTTAPIATTGASSSSVSLPTKPSYRCFADRKELKAAVDRYVLFGCSVTATLCTGDSDTYGWPMGSWCVIDVTDMSSLFKGLDAFNENISMWNVSQVTDMSYMFQNATSFNQNLCAWKDNFPYSSATDIFVDSGCAYEGTPSSAYQGPFCASSCNTISPADCFTTRDELKAAVDRYVQGYWGTADSSKYGWPIGSWCVGKVTDMSELFKDLSTFNEEISEWEVGQVTTMQGMFYGASAFDGNISSWDTSAVTDMSWMFWGASSFNGGDLSAWDTSSVTTMRSMFDRASAFNGNISSWDTSAVTDMSVMFWGASSFNGGDLSNWDTSAVTTMKEMFNGASAFNGNISSWDTSAVTDMSYMFWGASKFNQNLPKWDTSAVTTMQRMFYKASAFNGNISSWDTSAVTDMFDMFLGASSLNQDLSAWNTSAVTHMGGMFAYASAFNDGNISSWDTSAVIFMSWMFWEAKSFNQDLSAWNISAVTEMRGMFWGASSFNQDLSAWNTSAVRDMYAMFNEASSFNQHDLSTWDISAVTEMSFMFSPNREEWDTCADSTQCKNQCCSSKLSEGVLKCTPVGGFKIWEGCVAVGSSTITSSSTLGDWEKCFDSKQCENQCCSRKYSEGILKCTPLNPVEFKPSEGCVGSTTRRDIEYGDELI